MGKAKQIKKLSSAQKTHLKVLGSRFAEILAAKYEKGAAEHGGNLWDNPHLLDEAIDEVVDLYTYLMTLKMVAGGPRGHRFHSTGTCQ